MSNVPSGEEREVRHLGSATIDGAPVAYVVALAGVIAVLAFVPLSVVLGSGKSFPLSQSIYPLVGWLLGPVAGAVADGVGALVGVFLAPHTSALPLATVIGASMGALQRAPCVHRVDDAACSSLHCSFWLTLCIWGALSCGMALLRLQPWPVLLSMGRP